MTIRPLCFFSSVLYPLYTLFKEFIFIILCFPNSWDFFVSMHIYFFTLNRTLFDDKMQTLLHLKMNQKMF